MNEISGSTVSLPECISCNHKRCVKSNANTLDICDYGIAYFNTGESILKKREGVTLRHVAQNLRHELHKVLQLIISEACDIDNQVSVRQIDLNRPASRIVGATVILDHFIEMIAGVYSFDPYKEEDFLASSAVCIYDIAIRYRDTYALIRNTRRAVSLRFRIDSSLKKIFVSKQKHVVEYLIAVLIDNAWKYSEDNSPVIISANATADKLISLSIKNIAKFISQKEKLFERGYQADTTSEGFGFGLYWASLLVNHYNQALDRKTDLMNVEHIEGKAHNEKFMWQTFSINNILIEEHA